MLDQTPPQALGPGGHILLWPAYTRTSDVPLFMHPDGDFVMGWGILPGVPARFLDRALAQLDMASELSIHYGGKRYLSGFITFDTVGEVGRTLRRPLAAHPRSQEEVRSRRHHGAGVHSVRDRTGHARGGHPAPGLRPRISLIVSALPPQAERPVATPITFTRSPFR